MTDKEKDLPSDFGETTISVGIQKMFENNNNRIGKVLSPEEEKKIIASVIDEIKKLNPDTEMICSEVILFSDNPEKLKLPKGFYFSEINGITNKNIERSGVFVSINVYPLRYHPSFN